MRVEVRKGNVQKAIAILNKKVREDGDLRRSVERSTHLSNREKTKLKRAKARKYKKREVFENDGVQA